MTRPPEHGSLLTREERYLLRVHARDLKAQIRRARDTGERSRLEQLLANVEMEQANDKASRPRKPRS